MLIHIIECRKCMLTGIETYAFVLKVYKEHQSREHLIIVRATDLSGAGDLTEARNFATTTLQKMYAVGDPVESNCIGEALGVASFV